MKARVIHTKIWTDEYYRTLTTSERLFFLWLILNPHIDTLGIIEASDEIIAEQVKLESKEVVAIKKKFQTDKKIDFFKDYIHLSNAFKYQNYSGIKNVNPKLRTIYEMSDEALLYFSKNINLWFIEIEQDLKGYENNMKYEKTFRLYERVKNRFRYLADTPISTPMDTGQNTENRNKNTENRIQREKMEERLKGLGIKIKEKTKI